MSLRKAHVLHMASNSPSIAVYGLVKKPMFCMASIVTKFCWIELVTQLDKCNSQIIVAIHLQSQSKFNGG